MVELQRLGFGYGPQALFRDMDLSLTPGSIHGLLGINGAGKSTPRWEASQAYGRTRTRVTATWTWRFSSRR